MVKTIGDENAARLLWVHMEVHGCWGPRVQRLLLSPLLVAHTECGEPLHRLGGVPSSFTCAGDMITVRRQPPRHGGTLSL